MFLVMAIQEAVIYRFIYMMAFLYFVTAFQVSEAKNGYGHDMYFKG